MAYAAAAAFGFGIGGLLTGPPIAWADIVGRRSYSAIRVVVLSVQVTGLALASVVAILFLVPPKAAPQTSPS